MSRPRRGSSLTNSDAVILDLTPASPSPVLASHKAPTTSDVTLGIQAAIRECLAKADVDKSSIQAVAIGTTSFVNCLLERDVDKLERVAAIRLCGPYSRLTPPFASFPYELRHVLEGPVFFAEGGLQVDGKEISKVKRRLEISAVVDMSRWTRVRLGRSAPKYDSEVSRRSLCRRCLRRSITR